MLSIGYYESPAGRITIAADGDTVCGVWFAGQKYYPDLTGCAEADCPALSVCRRWLDLYFAGQRPDFLPPLAPKGSFGIMPRTIFPLQFSSSFVM